MSVFKPSFKSQLLLWSGAVLGVCLVFYFLPLFNVVPLKATREQSSAANFDAASFVDTLWKNELLKAAPHAVDASELLLALSKDRNTTTQKYGHRLGLSGNASYFIAGVGRVSKMEKDAVEITLKNGDLVVIETGPVFGNAIRDGSGLLDVSEFTNSQDFNAISTEINQRVEKSVLPELKEKAMVGALVKFVGGVDIADSETSVSRLNLVPVMIEFP